MSPGAAGRGMLGRWCFMGTEVQFEKMRSGGGDGHTTVGMYLMPLNWRLKMITLTHLLPQFKKRGTKQENLFPTTPAQAPPVSPLFTSPQLPSADGLRHGPRQPSGTLPARTGGHGPSPCPAPGPGLLQQQRHPGGPWLPTALSLGAWSKIAAP